MNNRITRICAMLLCAGLLLSAAPFSAFAFGINPQFKVDGVSVSTLADAFEKAADTGSVITQDGKTSDFLAISTGVRVEKNVTLSLGKYDFNANVNRITYEKTKKNPGEPTVMPDEPLFTIADGGVLTVKYAAFYGYENTVNTAGGLFRVEKGGTLILDGTADEPVVISGCQLTAPDAKGGAIYCEQGGKVIVNGAAFEGNAAAEGADIYAERKADVTIAEGVTVNAAYGENVDINGLNLVLTGEIGLTFHTVVPDKYLDGSFVLTSRTRDSVTYAISGCDRDAAGRYLAKYNLSSVELSEPVTLTVFDTNGNAVASKTKSVEEYGRALLSSDSVTEKEKAVVRALLNYGHYAQIECAAYEGWEPGRDYAETAKYADLETADSVFAPYTYTWTGHDPEISRIGVQLDFDDKTDILLHIPTAAVSAVSVGGNAAEIEKSKIKDYGCCVRIKDISILDLTKEFTVKVNDRITLTLSAMSYCRLVVGQNNENCKNAVKALYEFYLATVQYNEKSALPDEKTGNDGAAKN